MINPALLDGVGWVVLLLILVASKSDAFSSPLVQTTRTGLPAVEASTTPTSGDTATDDNDNTSSSGIVKPSRYVVTNRFQVKEGRHAAFEKRWADRESRLGTLPGFRFFCMLRRVDDNTGSEPNYISTTVWETYDDFMEWKTGDAFKEAHGGGTIMGVASMLIGSFQNTKGKPKLASWQGLLPETIPGCPPADGEGWRRVVADGETTLPTDCFVAMNRFSIVDGMENTFETRFANRESVLKNYDGFKGFLLLRRDEGSLDPDDGYTHSTISVWKDQSCFQVWREDAKMKNSNSADKKKGGNGPPPQIYKKPPMPAFYEGILSLESAKGV